MQGIREGLIFHLVTNSTANEKIQENSDRQAEGSILGAPNMVFDPTFGNCINFDGADDSINFPAFDQELEEMTIQAWVRMDDINDWQVIKNDQGWQSGCLHFQFRNGRLEFSINGNSPTDHWMANTFEPNIWYHLTMVYSQKFKYVDFYLNGQFQERKTYQLTKKLKKKVFQVGSWNNSRWFKGNITHLRVFNRILSATDILENMEQDRFALAATKRSFPVHFDLLNEQEQNVLYITDETQGQDLHLTLTNTSGKTIELKTPTEGADNYNFQLVFRPETLLETRINDIQLEAVSHVANNLESDFQLDNSVNGVTSLLLKTTGPKNWHAGQNLKFLLKNIFVNGGEGSRNSRVMLLYHNMRFAETENNFDGFREVHMDIVNHRGRKNIPLHFGFKGSNYVMNKGGGASDLILRLSNVSDEVLSVNPDGQPASHLILAFDPPTEDWALADSDQFDGIHVHYQYHNGNQLPATGPADFTWTIPLFPLAPGEWVDISISDIITNRDTGHANLYLYYLNIPGYWDGFFAKVIEKMPIYFSADKNVGIGTTNPQIDLAIGDTDTGLQQQGDGELAIYTNGSERVRVDKAGKVGIRTSDPRIDLAIGDTDTGLQQQGDGELAIYTNGSERVRVDKAGKVGVRTNDPRIDLAIGDTDTGLQQQGNGELAIYTNGSERVRVDKEGKVGIRTSDPRIDLAIGDTDTGLQQQGNGELAIYTNNVERMRIGKTGKVGIRASNPLLDLAIGDNDTGLQQEGDGHLAIYTDRVKKLQIDKVGNVSIAMNNSGSQLHMNGYLRLQNGTSVNKLSTSLESNHSSLATGKAIKDYIDGQIRTLRNELNNHYHEYYQRQIESTDVFGGIRWWNEKKNTGKKKG